MVRLLITGDRNWNNYKTIEEAILNLNPNIIIHGGAKGADYYAGVIGKLLGIKVYEFQADWDKYGKAAGVIRNQQMLDEGKPDVVYAFHNNINESKGTKDMVKRASGIIPIVLFNNNGIYKKIKINNYDEW